MNVWFGQTPSEGRHNTCDFSGGGRSGVALIALNVCRGLRIEFVESGILVEAACNIRSHFFPLIPCYDPLQTFLPVTVSKLLKSYRVRDFLSAVNGIFAVRTFVKWRERASGMQ